MQILPDEEAEILKEHWVYEPLEEDTKWTTLTNCTVEDFYQSVLMHPSVMSMKPHFGSRFNSSVFDEFNNDYSNMNLHSNGENIKRIKLSKCKNKRVVYSCATIKDSRKKKDGFYPSHCKSPACMQDGTCNFKIRYSIYQIGQNHL